MTVMIARPAATRRAAFPSKSNPVNHEFLTHLPAVETHARIAFRRLPEEEKEDAVAEAIASAFCNFISVKRRGKAACLKSSMLARYAVLSVTDGRHVGGRRDTQFDALGWRAAQHRRLAIHALHGAKYHAYDCLSPNDAPVWRYLFLEDRRTPVSDQVAFRIDWSTFLSRQSDRTRRIVAVLAEGHRRCDVADRFGVTASALTQRMNRVRREWLAFQGDAPHSAPYAIRSHNTAAARRRERRCQPEENGSLIARH